MYKRYSTVKISTNVKNALDELNPRGKNYGEVIGELVKKARLLTESVHLKREIKSHEAAARIAMEKAASIHGMLGDITNRSLIRVVTYDYDSTYFTHQEKDFEGEVLKFDHSKKISKFEREARLYLVLGSPNKGVIEVVKERSDSGIWTVRYMDLTPFQIVVQSSKPK